MSGSIAAQRLLYRLGSDRWRIDSVAAVDNVVANDGWNLHADGSSQEG